MKPFYITVYNYMIWFRLYSSWITVEDRKSSRSQEKNVKYAKTSVHSYLTKRTLYFNAVSTFFQQASYLSACRPLFFVLWEKITSKNLPLVSCFGEIKFCWKSAEIWLPYHLGSIYAKWLALNILASTPVMKLNRHFERSTKKLLWMLTTNLQMFQSLS